MITALALALSLTASVRAEPDVRACLETFPSLDVLVERWKRRPPVDAAVWDSYLGDYYTCRALALGRDTPCSKLKDLSVSSHEGVPLEEVCQSGFLVARLAKSVMERSPDALRFCVDAIQYFVGHLQCGPPVELARDNYSIVGYQLKQCALFLENVESPLRGMERTALACHGTLRPTRIDYIKFLEGVLNVTGADPTCSFQIPDNITSCRVFSLFRKARAAGDPRLCEYDPTCLQMMGGGVENCEFYAWKLKNAYCARASYSPSEPSVKGQ